MLQAEMPLTRPGPALVKVTGWFGGTPLHEPAYRGIAKRSKAWAFDSHMRRFKSCYPCHSRPLEFSARQINMVGIIQLSIHARNSVIVERSATG